ncbi:DUF2599 domain-containing protein [Sanguibacter sp. 25GB23B1]|uniref:DUF2599 domain-containing protein n=1 Tax=unclassified Sanguibacter TaxID=2645534 RepID=UPI0032AEE27C
MVQLLGEDLTVAQTPSTTLDPDGDGGTHVRTTVAEPGAVRYTFDAPDESVVTVARDDSVAVVGADGTLLAGFAEPVVTDATGEEVRARWTPVEDGPDRIALDLAPDDAERRGADSTTAYPLTIEVHLGRDVVSGVEWGVREGGTSLAVTPTAWGRASGTTGRSYGWADVVRLEPSADTTVMRNQFLCHVDGARQKDTWNLEPWRPDISFIGYLLARCNPT